MTRSKIIRHESSPSARIPSIAKTVLPIQRELRASEACKRRAKRNFLRLLPYFERGGVAGIKGRVQRPNSYEIRNRSATLRESKEAERFEALASADVG